ncbi:MAG: hypothetical protein AAFZ18_23930, partial [Myxococcota bacterium]
MLERPREEPGRGRIILRTMCAALLLGAAVLPAPEQASANLQAPTASSPGFSLPVVDIRVVPPVEGAGFWTTESAGHLAALIEANLADLPNLLPQVVGAPPRRGLARALGEVRGPRLEHSGQELCACHRILGHPGEKGPAQVHARVDEDGPVDRVPQRVARSLGRRGRKEAKHGGRAPSEEDDGVVVRARSRHARAAAGGGQAHLPCDRPRDPKGQSLRVKSRSELLKGGAVERSDSETTRRHVPARGRTYGDLHAQIRLRIDLERQLPAATSTGHASEAAPGRSAHHLREEVRKIRQVRFD